VDTPKSHVDIYVNLVASIVRRSPLVAQSPRSHEKDLAVLNRRTSSEGLSFLTKTLPKLGKALDEALVTQRFNCPREFARISSGDSRPAFLQASFKRIFGSDGVLLDSASPDDVQFIRQVAFVCYKLEMPFGEQEVRQVIDGFVATETELSSYDYSSVAPLLDATSYIIRDIFLDFDPKDINPRHGPGAVATGERLSEKWNFSRLIDSAHQYYPYYEYFVVGGPRELEDRLEWYKSLERVKHGRAKVVLVPKDSRGPRLISAEPLELMYLQQGLGRKIVDHLEAVKLTKGYVNFTSQEVNRSLALESSLTGRYATLDLKDASDRISMPFVRHVFQHVPELLRALESIRSTSTKLPDGRIVELTKHAPMGSALCFPILAVSTWSLLVAGIARATRGRPTVIRRSVYIYGDDIIIPVEWTDHAVHVLESVGLRVNRLKSCTRGFFRESCGMDAFKGVQVTPTRVKKPWSGLRSDGVAYTSWIQLANNLLANGYTEAYEFIHGELKKTYGKIPYGLPTSPFPCLTVPEYSVADSRNRKQFKFRYNHDRQVIEFRVPFTRSRHQAVELDSWPRLLRDVLSSNIEDPSVDVLPRSSVIKRGWKAIG
jgi:hypothetical protein